VNIPALWKTFRAARIAHDTEFGETADSGVVSAMDSSDVRNHQIRRHPERSRLSGGVRDLAWSFPAARSDPREIPFGFAQGRRWARWRERGPSG
jgi:hypothetical protein